MFPSGFRAAVYVAALLPRILANLFGPQVSPPPAPKYTYVVATFSLTSGDPAFYRQLVHDALLKQLPNSAVDIARVDEVKTCGKIDNCDEIRLDEKPNSMFELFVSSPAGLVAHVPNRPFGCAVGDDETTRTLIVSRVASLVLAHHNSVHSGSPH